jgi:hypothetical protein
MRNESGGIVGGWWLVVGGLAIQNSQFKNPFVIFVTSW